ATVEAKAGSRRNLVEDVGHELDLLVVGSDAQTHQPVRRRQPVEQVDLDDARVAEQMIGGVEAGGPGADDRGAQWPFQRPDQGGQRAGPPSSARSWVCSVSSSP